MFTILATVIEENPSEFFLQYQQQLAAFRLSDYGITKIKQSIFRASLSALALANMLVLVKQYLSVYLAS